MQSQRNLPEKEGQNRSLLYDGLLVDIVLKQDQKTMTLTRGKIKEFLTSKPFHPRGIKVRLHKQDIKRLYDTSSRSKEKDINYETMYEEENFVGRVQRVYYPECFGILVLYKHCGGISEGFYNEFEKIYTNNTYFIIDESLLNKEIKTYIHNLDTNLIDIVLNEESLNFFIKNSYLDIKSFCDSIDKKLNVYIYKHNSFSNLVTGVKKIYRSL